MSKKAKEEPLTKERIVAAGIPKTWDCIDCGANTAPGVHNAAELARAFSFQAINPDATALNITDECEIYIVKKWIWSAAGNPDGCLCIGCLEKRLGRELRPRDFDPKNEVNWLPGTERLLSRRTRPVVLPDKWPDDRGGDGQ